MKYRFGGLGSVSCIYIATKLQVDNYAVEHFIPYAIFSPGANRYDEFGTGGNGQFRQKMIRGNIHISNTFDKIPLSGGVTKKHLNKFSSVFLKEPDVTSGWVSSAARLLAMKRSDAFYDVTKQKEILQTL